MKHLFFGISVLRFKPEWHLYCLNQHELSRSHSMKKIKQSFVEVIAGQPRKEHYIKVTIALLLITLAAGSFITLIFTLLNVKK